MADLYQVGEVPKSYDADFLKTELDKIQACVNNYEAMKITLVPQGTVPDKADEGDIVNADGTLWNPGGGAGLYEYKGGAYVKL